MLKKLKVPQESLHILVALLSADFLFFFLYALHKIDFVKELLPALKDMAFAISQDLSLSEGYQYLKWFWIALLLAWLAYRYRKAFYVPWSLLFTYLMFDDMLSIHERVGGFFSKALGFDPEARVLSSLRAQDLGELATSAIAAGVLFGLILLFFWRGNQEVRLTYRNLFLLMVTLVFFGIGFDMLDRFFDQRIIELLLKFAEDGGEMLTASFILWYVYTLFLKEKAAAALPAA
jgi:hypothetical protein